MASEGLRQIAVQLREKAAERAQVREVKTAQLLMAACALHRLNEKVKTDA